MKKVAPSHKLFLVFLLFSLLWCCARMEQRPLPNVQTGMASWYGPGFHGQFTSSREIYDMYDMTAAHRTLPFGTFVMVTNLENGKSVTVRINDRGPFVKGRIIDLSYAAASLLDIVVAGVVPVKIEVVSGYKQDISSQKFSVQVGAFIYRENAIALKKELQKKYTDVYITLFKTANQTYYRVRIKTENKEASLKAAEKLSREGYRVLLLEEQ